MNLLVLHILATYGLWYVIGQSSLPGWSKLRDRLMEKSETFGRFLLCPVCSGFWISLAFAAGSVAWGAASGYEAGLRAFAGAAGCLLLETHVSRLQAK